MWTICNLINVLDWNILISTAIGALIGSVLTLLATFIAHWLSSKKEKDDRNQEIRALLQSLQDEATTIWDIYMEGVGVRLEEHEVGEPFNVYFPVTQEYFTIYTSNAQKIGMIQDDNLRKSIVEGYALGRSLIDTYRMNNELVRTYRNNQSLFQITNSQVYRDLAEASRRDLITYSSALKIRHNSFKEKVNQLIVGLNEYKI